MFGEQTAKQSQRKHQDSMKGNPKSGVNSVKRKTQKSVRFKIEEDKVIEAHVTHWQVLESQDRVRQRQELKSNRITTHYQALDQQSGTRKEEKQTHNSQRRQNTKGRGSHIAGHQRRCKGQLGVKCNKRLRS
jgi:hypothetical protein